MPQLPTYSAQLRGLTGATGGGRRATADDFAGGIAGVGGAGDTLMRVADQLQDTADRANVSDIQAKLAQAQAEWTVNLIERGHSLQPGDTTFLPKFDEDFQKYVQDTENSLVQSEAGRRAFQEGVAKMRGHFFARAGEMQIAAVANKAKQDFGSLVDGFSRTVTLDPTQADTLLARTKEVMNDPTGIYARVPVPERQELLRRAQEEISYAAAKGLIVTMNQPELAMRKLKEGHYAGMDPQKLDDLIERAGTRIKQNEQEVQNRKAIERQEKADIAEAAERDWQGKIINSKTSLKELRAMNDQIAADPRLRAVDQRAVYGMLNAKIANKTGEGAAPSSNPEMVRKLRLEIIGAEEDATKTFSRASIDQAYRDRKINDREADYLLSIHGKSTSAFQKKFNNRVTMVERNLAASDLKYDPDDLSKIQLQMKFETQEQVDTWMKNNPNKDPSVLLDPKNIESPFHPVNMARFTAPPGTVLAKGAQKVVQGARKEVSGKITTPGQPVAPTAYSDAEKERRYQEWKAKQKQ